MSEREAFMAWAEDVRPACTYADHSYPAYTKAQMLDCWQAASAGKAELLAALEGLMELERRDRFMPIGREWDAARAAIAKHGGTR